MDNNNYNYNHNYNPQNFNQQYLDYNQQIIQQQQQQIQQMYTNQHIIQQQQQQIQQMIQQQNMQNNQYINPYMNQSYQMNPYGQHPNNTTFDFSKIRINNLYSLVAAIILFCGFFVGNLVIQIAEYSDEIRKFNIKETCDVFDQMVNYDRANPYEKVEKIQWIASKFIYVIIIAIIVLGVGTFIDIGIVRIITLIILSISYICTFGAITDIEELAPGFSFIVLLAGIITGFISCAEGNNERINNKYEFKEYKLSADSSIPSGKTWKCIECGKDNPIYLTTCKCGTTKSDSERRTKGY